eukprot:GFUD01079018.1.p1 GENE.GFUD01079018.1~~GFUD01079018.1.p1  ORF type:complete len:145 (+),score=36.56 GFUD01079018.1:1924-2358(+)
MIEKRDLLYGPRRKDGMPEWIRLSERITKTRQGNAGEEREVEPVIYPDDEYLETCSVRTVLEYQRHKTPEQLNLGAPFFLNQLLDSILVPKHVNKDILKFYSASHLDVPARPPLSHPSHWFPLPGLRSRSRCSSPLANWWTQTP